METETVVEDKPCSRYTGGAVAPRLMKWLAFFVSLITLSLAHPAMVCWQERYRCRHTYIDGKRLKFDGHALQLLGKYVCWVLLTIVTLFVYSFWLSVKMKKWVTKHTHFADEADDYESEKKSKPAMTDEERAAYETKLNERKKTAHTVGTVTLVLTFVMPPWALIMSIIGIVFSGLAKERHGLRLCTVALGILLTVFSAMLIIFVGKPETAIMIISIAAVAAVAIAACVTVFIVTRKWENYSAPKA